MTELDLIQVLVLGFSTGFGSSFGVEVSKFLISRAQTKKESAKK